MSEYSIIVEYETIPGHSAEFVAIMTEHASRTREEEPGCLRFELLQAVDGNGQPMADRFIVNELYAGRSAVETHERSPRLARVRAALTPLVATRRLIKSVAIFPHCADEGIRPEDLNAANDG